MSKRYWLIPILIVAVNVLAIILRWSSLPESLPAHFDLQGHAAGQMPRGILISYPLIGAAFSLVCYLIARYMQKLHAGLVILASGISLILLASTMVTLTSGKIPFFMLSEPAILIATLVAFAVCVVRSRKERR